MPPTRLDSRSLESLVFALASPAGGGRMAPLALRVHCYLRSDSLKARQVYRRRKKFRLLEELLDCRVDVEIAHAHAHALRMVA